MKFIRNLIAEGLGINIINSIKGYKIYDYYNLFLSSVNWSRDEVVNFQVKKLNELIRYSYNNSPFYKNRIDAAGFNIEKFKYPDQLKNIPKLTREELRVYLKDIISKEFDLYKCSKSSSSGSTGDPLTFYHDKNGIAAQTQYDNYYSILDPHVYVEFDDPIDSNRKTSKVLVTDLDNRVLPFIRYENGDLAVPLENSETDELKPNFSKLHSIDGRESDLITLPNGGKLVVPSFFGSRMLRDIEGVKQY